MQISICKQTAVYINNVWPVKCVAVTPIPREVAVLRLAINTIVIIITNYVNYMYLLLCEYVGGWAKQAIVWAYEICFYVHM